MGFLFRNELNYFFDNENLNMSAIGCGPINRLIFTNKFIKNRKDRDFFENSNAQAEFSRLLKNQKVFVNWNGLYHFSMAHTQKILENLITIIKRVSMQVNKL